MVREVQHEVTKNPVSLLLVEGETDEIFYKRIKSELLASYRITIQNLEGLYNINAKVINRIIRYLQQHKDEKIIVYCCIDRESRYGTVPGFDLKRIKKYIKEQVIQNVLSINVIIATKQIESWFFYDLEGIYRYLKVPGALRNLNTFKPPEKFGYKDIQRLFGRYGKNYTKGKKSKNFIEHLNIKKIASQCKELAKGIAIIQSKSDDTTNHLFRSRKQKNV